LICQVKPFEGLSPSNSPIFTSDVHAAAPHTDA
jgi:hypothetical protein